MMRLKFPVCLLLLSLLYLSSVFPQAPGILYWEYPDFIIQEQAKYPRVAAGGGLMAVVWQEIEVIDDETWETYLSIQSSRDGYNWDRNERFAGPFTFAGTEAPISSIAVNSDGTVFIAASIGEDSVSVFQSSDGGNSFAGNPVTVATEGDIAVAPRLFTLSNGGIILYITQKYVGDAGLTGATLARTPLSVYYAVSSDGLRWTSFAPLVTEPDLVSNYTVLPYHAAINGIDYVVFQSLVTLGRTTSYQLYMKTSTDEGRSWSPAVLLTGFAGMGSDLLKDDAGYIRFDNQRAFLVPLDKGMGISWERRRVGDISTHVFFGFLDENLSSGLRAEQVTTGNLAHQSPESVQYNGDIYTFWFDNREGDNRIFTAARSDRGGIVEWIEPRETNKWFGYNTGVSTFPNPVIVNGMLYVFWENAGSDNNRFVLLAPDRTVPRMELSAENFKAGERHKQDIYSFTWRVPDDSSGVEGYSYVLDRNPGGLPPLRIKAFRNVLNTQMSVQEDGNWYFHISARDKAGNWSVPETISFYRDTTPPPPVTIEVPELDEEGYTLSNTHTFTWQPPDDPYIRGYSYNLEYLGSAEREIDPETVNLSGPPHKLLVTVPEVYFRNLDNGLWAFSVQPVDSVGNFGPTETIFLRLNKYVPETYITGVEAPKDILGRVTLTLRGRGFAEGGQVEQVLLDRDGEEPFDYIFPLDSGLYTVESDRIITGPTIEDVEEGSYRIGLLHPKRGLYFTRSFLQLESTGTIKFGDFRIREKRRWIPVQKYLLSLSINSAVIWVVFVFMGLLMLLAGRRVLQLAREGRMLQLEADMILSEEGLPAAIKKERISDMRRKGMGLRFKFTLFITVLVILVVLGVSFPLGLFMIETQRKSLVEGLENQTKVLLESLVSGARNPLRSQRRLEMGLLLRQKSAMADATFVTITGPGNPVPEPYDYVWVTDDPDIVSNIEGDQLFLEKSLMSDAISYRLRTLAQDINTKADEQLSALIEERKRLSPEALALSRKGDEESLLQLSRLQDQITAIDQEITARLFEIGDVVQSDPEFTIENIVGENRNFTFFKPIVDQPVREGSKEFLRGAVRLGVSTERIVAAIRNSVLTLLIRAAIIAAIAIGIGIAGALLLATIIIQPIKRLVRGVELIRDTEDKEMLKEHVIDVRTRDEISTLADTVNQMTMGLVKAAVASKDLTVGKEVQKMFIPLEKDSAGNKVSTGKEETDKVEFFGYYEGAKGVSGDYFDFKKLDEQHYAIIKCDVAGKGVPASLIMVEVATIFLNYFRNWSLEKDGIRLDQLVYSINDLLEERGFKGRFAALIVVIFNVETGVVYMCNAGDNLVHMYDKKKERMWTKTLPEAPASGVFPSMLVEMQSGFKQVPHQLGHGDTMFLFTDGIEEAQRRFRDDTFSLITCQEPGLKEGDPHGNHVRGSEFEELGIPRIQEIINAVFRKHEYRLVKFHNPVPDENLVFDFTECESTVEEAVMAMVSVEKVFRIYRDPTATSDDRIHIDRKIDEFLKGHFLQYDLLFNHPLEQKDGGEYVVYTHLKEDEQFDDLTILGMLRK